MTYQQNNFVTLFVFKYETALLRPDVSAHPGLIGCILRNVLDCHQMPRINESLLATVLYLLNHPRTRCYIRANVDLEVSQYGKISTYVRLRN